MIISDIKEDDENKLKEFLEKGVNEGRLFKYKSTINNVIQDCKYRNSGNNIVSYPDNTLKVLNKLNSIKECTIYEYSRDGWGCIYTNINAIII